ncbi:hypothetical protein VTK56DRAFT_1672 [Thermocarpiscus australiensis]
MATEIAFAKSFLSLLDTKPAKITADHVEDPRTLPASRPYILTRHASSKPLSKPRSSIATSSSVSSTKQNPGAELAVTVTLRSARNPPLEIVLPARGVHSTSAADLKQAVASQTGLALDKIKLLYGKKPVADVKVLKEIMGEEALKSGNATAAVEFGVMVLGGTAALPPKQDKDKQEEDTS